MSPNKASTPVPSQPSDWPFRPEDASIATGNAMVVTTDRYASEVGVQVLGDGGNAVDAAIAAAFALAVVNPEAGNLGGGGFMLFRTPPGATSALDYRSCAPGAASPDMYKVGVGSGDEPSVTGHLAVAVPGSVRGMWDAHRRFGRVTWGRLVEPSVSLARGFTVRERFNRSFEDHIVTGLARFPSSRSIFLPNGSPPQPGATFVQSDLAAALERIRDHGADGFYRGRTADLIVAEMQRGGGLIDHDDLAGYRAVWREPMHFPYRDRTVVSMPPPSSGGVTLAMTGNILRGFDLGALEWHGPDHIHLLTEAWRRAFADRNHHLADPDFVSVPTERLVAEDYGAARAKGVSLTHATPSDRVGPTMPAPPEGRHTTHVSVVDGEGAAVSLTTTINTWYGSKVVAEGTGVLLNNDMDDFSARPGEPNFFGLVQGAANAIRPRKRMLSAMTPTMILDRAGRLRLVVGSPGGATIITTVFQVVSNMIDFGMGLPEAVSAPRVHHQHRPDELRVEPGGLPEHVIRELMDRGHRLVEHHEVMSDVQAVLVRADGTVEGVSDPRRGGAACAA